MRRRTLAMSSETRLGGIQSIESSSETKVKPTSSQPAGMGASPHLQAHVSTRASGPELYTRLEKDETKGRRGGSRAVEERHGLEHLRAARDLKSRCKSVGFGDWSRRGRISNEGQSKRIKCGVCRISTPSKVPNIRETRHCGLRRTQEGSFGRDHTSSFMSKQKRIQKECVERARPTQNVSPKECVKRVSHQKARVEKIYLKKQGPRDTLEFGDSLASSLRPRAGRYSNTRPIRFVF